MHGKKKDSRGGAERGPDEAALTVGKSVCEKRSRFQQLKKEVQYGN
jgi:hypothetical protein